MKIIIIVRSFYKCQFTCFFDDFRDILGGRYIATPCQGSSGFIGLFHAADDKNVFHPDRNGPTNENLRC